MFCFHASIFAGSHRHLMNHWTKSMRFCIHLNESLCCVQKWEWIDEFRKKKMKNYLSSWLSSPPVCRLLSTVVCSWVPSALTVVCLWLLSALDCRLLLTTTWKRLHSTPALRGLIFCTSKQQNQPPVKINTITLATCFT